MKALTHTLGLLLYALVIGITWTVMLARPASAAPQCAPWPSVVEQLADKWQEVERGQGLAHAGSYVVTLFHDAAGDTWTLVGMTSDGTACVLASGTGWEAIAPTPVGREG